MGERLVRNQKVVSSILITSTTTLKACSDTGFLHLADIPSCRDRAGFSTQSRTISPNSRNESRRLLSLTQATYFVCPKADIHQVPLPTQSRTSKLAITFLEAIIGTLQKCNCLETELRHFLSIVRQQSRIKTYPLRCQSSPIFVE